MDDDTRARAEHCAREAGAIVPCPVCGKADIGLDDAEAAARAYGRAEAARAAEEEGFRGMSAEQVKAAMTSFLDDFPRVCVQCPRDDEA